MAEPPRETALYPPVKRFLEGQGYAVKGEIGPADVVALRGDEPPVIVELKTGFSLALIHQGIDRQTITPHVYLAVPDVAGRRGWTALRANLKLARRLGLGVMTVRAADGLVTVHCDPGPFRPRLLKAPRERLLREFAARRGDPTAGGATRDGLVTAYRQDALLLAAHLAQAGPRRGRDVRDATGVARATTMLRDNHYGWFVKVATGVYDLSEAGRAATAPGEA
ncbi:DUF2161 domain-containing phosphodiesterase [Jannaschia seohaensis]|uniref:Uncharacterized protein n=1 Tax=Jannaschia seohaensis TaxID=475081 RepID=A0A2Y9C8T1_9RHOB|nr:DUF2161 family putative PD-(D/E)XK-type phosphodiesterase [Jannaschia seohaensis]PWJ14438.1 hypothetical protein BCF38_11261 [Jannaschia seohaensis]SSA50173.1 hypothetical protein SAMN05421539_11261 [Jannaschia seohaensis]